MERAIQSFFEVVSSHLCCLCAFDFAVAHFGNVSFLFAIIAFSILKFAICRFVCSALVAFGCLWQIVWGFGILKFHLVAVAFPNWWTLVEGVSCKSIASFSASLNALLNIGSGSAISLPCRCWSTLASHEVCAGGYLQIHSILTVFGVEQQRLLCLGTKMKSLHDGERIGLMTSFY